MNEFADIRQNPLWKASIRLSKVLLKLFREDRGLVQYLIEDIPSLAARIVTTRESSGLCLMEQMEEFCRQVECKLNDYAICNPEVPLFRAWFRLGQLRTEIFDLLYNDEFVVVQLEDVNISAAG